jgi:hypothetical protein
MSEPPIRHAPFDMRVFTREQEPELARCFLERQDDALRRYGCRAARVGPDGEGLCAHFLACCESGEREPVGGLVLTLPEREGARLPIETVLESLAMLGADERIYPPSWRTGYLGSLWMAERYAGSGVLAGLMDAGFELCCGARMDCMVGLCSPHMLAPTLAYGFRVDRRFGRGGFFPYPDARYMTSVVYREM